MVNLYMPSSFLLRWIAKDWDTRERLPMIKKKRLKRFEHLSANTLKLRLHTAINRADFVSGCMLYTRTKVTKCTHEKMTLYFRIGEPLNHIHQGTKSARLIAVCKRSIKNTCCDHAINYRAAVYLWYKSKSQYYLHVHTRTISFLEV